MVLGGCCGVGSSLAPFIGITDEGLLSRLDVLRALRRLHLEASRDPVAEDLRGWCWDRPPVRPRAYLGLGVSEVASYCPTRRDVYLRRVLGVRPRRPGDGPLRIGVLVHRVFEEASRDARKALVDGLSPWEAYEALASGAEEKLKKLGVQEGWAIGLYKCLVMSWLAEAARCESIMGGEGAQWLPWPVEVRVDGSPLGLSKQLRVDAIAEGGVVVEVKYGKPSENHYLAVTGYALALESMLEAPFDYAVLVYINGVPEGKPRLTLEPVYISSSLRRDFLEARDEVVDMLLAERDPGKPSSCPHATCPYAEACSP